MAIVSIRYVKALINLTTKENRILYADKLNNLASIYTNNLEFKNMVDNPEVSNQDKLDIIISIIKPDKILTNFINELLKEQRISYINDIAKKYQAEIDKLESKLNIEIVTSIPITEKEAQEIADKFKNMYKVSAVNYQIKLNKKIIGGIKVIVNDKVYDNTLETKLEELFGK